MKFRFWVTWWSNWCRRTQLMFRFPICCASNIPRNDQRHHFEMHCFRLHGMSNMCAERLNKIEVIRETCHTSPTKFLTKRCVLSLWLYNSDYFSVSAFFVIRFDSLKTEVLVIICAQNSRSEVVQFSLMFVRRKTDTHSWLCILWTECPSMFALSLIKSQCRSKRFHVENGYFELDEQVLFVPTQSRFFPINMLKDESLQNCCPTPISLICVLHVHLLFRNFTTLITVTLPYVWWL